MQRSFIVLAALGVAATTGLPLQAQAQKANYCDPSGYVTGVYSDRDNPHQPCDPRQVPRVSGVPQGQPAPGARRGYNETQPTPPPANAYDNRYDRRYDNRYGYENRYDNRYDERRMGNRDSRDGDRYREGRYYYGARGPEWRRGAHIPREYMGRQYWVDDWRGHHLSAPPRGYRWVQVGDDYVLVAIASGIIAQLLLSH